MISRRSVILGCLGSSTILQPALAGKVLVPPERNAAASHTSPYNPALIPPPESPIDYPIEYIPPSKFKRRFRMQRVDYEGSEEPGTLIVDPENRFLFHVLEGNEAVRYGVGVGREGFAWSGDAQIAMKRKWPRWMPPPEMLERDSTARGWPNGMPGGPDNPLGARALYLYANGVDTLYRIHGTNAPQSIGKAQSSGCIRMLNQDIAELYPRVAIGTKVIVLPASHG